MLRLEGTQQTHSNFTCGLIYMIKVKRPHSHQHHLSLSFSLSGYLHVDKHKWPTNHILVAY
jgi:hypothetical protein